MYIGAYFTQSLSNKLAFMPVASALVAIHRDHLVLAFDARWPAIQSLTSQGQSLSVDVP